MSGISSSTAMTNALAGTGTSSPTGSTATASSSAADNMDFMKLIVAQMKNQNPMDPSNSDQMVQSMSMMQLVNETHQMNSKMAGWAQTQGLLLGANIIGGQATLRTSEGAEVKGKVESVAVNNGEVKISVNSQLYPLSSVVNVQY